MTEKHPDPETPRHRYRSKRLDTPGTLNDSIGTKDRPNWPPAVTAEQEQVRHFIRAGLCPWCNGTRKDRRGPWTSIAGHVAKAHGVDRFQLREAAGLYRSSQVCSDAHHQRVQDRARRANTLVVTPDGPRRPRTLSAAAVRLQRGKLGLLPGGEAVRAEIAMKSRVGHAALSPEQRSEAARAGAAAAGAAARRRAGERLIGHGIGAAVSHGCKCVLCRAYRRWAKRKGPKPTPVYVPRPCYPDCTACATQLATAGVRA